MCFPLSKRGSPFLKPFPKPAFLRFFIVLESVVGKTHQKVFVFGRKHVGEDVA